MNMTMTLNKVSITFLFCCILQLHLTAQNDTVTSWWNPIDNEFPVVTGNGWTSELGSLYHRLPEDAEQDVREPLWNLSKHSAGLSIRFWTNSKDIQVKYKLKGDLGFPHMPATGVSGLDLYKKTKDGSWQRLWGQYKLDSISNYNFKSKNTSTEYKEYGAEYQLFLPLYNEVENLSIGVDANGYFKPIPRRKEKPIVVYGTSIVQGACASRPGMAWTNILERRLDRPVINLGFSGNGKLEPALIELMSEIDAKVFIIDCLPNLSAINNPFLLTINAVKILKEKHPETPIVLVAHPGYVNSQTDISKDPVKGLNEDLQTAITTLKSLGYKRVYYLSKEDLNLSFDSFVDYIHPNDIGMTQYADATEKIYRELFREFKGNLTTTQPVTQYRDIAVYNWEERHQQILELNKTAPPKICLFGDSITHFWGGEPEAPIARNKTSWDSISKSEPIRNFGFGWDRVENVLWRVQHGELDGFNAEKIILMLGTNNLTINNENDIVEGLDKLIETIKYRQPKSEILLIGVLPRKGKESQVSQLNLKMAMFALENSIEYNHIGNVLLLENHKIDTTLFSDGLHPNSAGYELLSKELHKVIYGIPEQEEEIEKD